jgi:hypothetical protein
MIAHDLLVGESIFLHAESFETIFHHSEILYPSEELVIGLRYDRLDIEIPETLPVFFTPVQYEFPRDTCLSSLETEELEERVIIMQWYSPLFVMIGDIERIFRIGPAAASFFGHSIISYRMVEYN